MADEACVVRLARNRERTQTENRSNEQPQNQPRTIILIPHDIMISNIKFHLYDISSQSETMSAVFMMLFGLAVYSSIPHWISLKIGDQFPKQGDRFPFNWVTDFPKISLCDWVTVSHWISLQMSHNELGETKTAILIGLEGQGTHDKYGHDKYAWPE